MLKYFIFEGIAGMFEDRLFERLWKGWHTGLTDDELHHYHYVIPQLKVEFPLADPQRIIEPVGLENHNTVS